VGEGVRGEKEGAWEMEEDVWGGDSSRETKRKEGNVERGGAMGMR